MKNVVMLGHLDHFDVRQILESGQVFRFEKITEQSYMLVAKQKVIKLAQHEESSSVMIYNTNISELDEVWSHYLDIDTNYAEITSTLSAKDEYMAKAVTFGRGIRILKQDPWEMLISFIISQNKAISHIKECIKNISMQFGTPIEDEECKGYYTFPTPEQLKDATEEDLRACKVGFRAPYILDACHKILNEEIVLNELYLLPAEEAKEKLMSIKGVGPKIADCILLFAYSKMELFPTDVWIKRVMEGLYFEGREVKLAEIQKFAKSYFGDLAGYAQQYLFFYGRENALFTEKIKTKEKA
ncbi:DNA-3-methyladenine glycosylase family protein [Cellulosilyticum ruminicola]|uniref:DNA-3-methyladenine glycosylase family protein n=1 Tax=Cellulosilyticum ruminicola TaxID=425254 RepID=UPI0006D228F9|nr:DNA glycosylase [Cellulosilyticum ruminicola]